VADRGYHSGAVLQRVEELGLRSYIAEPKRLRRKWRGRIAEQKATYANHGPEGIIVGLPDSPNRHRGRISTATQEFFESRQLQRYRLRKRPEDWTASF
jgi:hypothetical protein